MAVAKRAEQVTIYVRRLLLATISARIGTEAIPNYRIRGEKIGLKGEVKSSKSGKDLSVGTVGP
jgi:hypothetical protein